MPDKMKKQIDNLPIICKEEQFRAYYSTEPVCSENISAEILHFKKIMSVPCYT